MVFSIQMFAAVQLSSDRRACALGSTIGFLLRSKQDFVRCFIEGQIFYTALQYRWVLI